MKPERTLYDVLEVSHRVSPVVLKAAYRSLAQSLHPDKHAGTKVCDDRLAEINAAYSIVSDPAKRLSYDQSLGLSATCTERRRIVPAGDSGYGRFHSESNGPVSRPFGFRPLK